MINELRLGNIAGYHWIEKEQSVRCFPRASGAHYTIQIKLKLSSSSIEICLQIKQIKLFVTYTIIQCIMSSEMCSLHLTHPSGWVGQPTVRRPGSSWGFGALLKGLTSVVDTSCWSQDSNQQHWVTSGFKSNALSIRPRLPH